MDKVRIALVQSTIPHYRLPVVAALAARPDVELTVLTTPGGPWATAKQVDTDLIPKAQVMPVGLTHLPGLELIRYRGFRRKLREVAPDVVIAEPRMGLLSVIGFAFFPVRTDRGRPRLVWWFPGWRNVQRSAFVYRMSDLLAWMVVRRARAVASYGSRAAARAQELGISAERITIAQNSIDTNDVETAVARARLDSPHGADSGLRLLFVGQILLRKHLELLFEAMRSGGEHCQGAVARIVGAGDARDHFIRLHREMGLEGRIEWIPQTTDPDQLAPHLAWAELGVLPHAGGLMLNTCMAAGIPVICGDADGTEDDLVVHGRTGWRFTGKDWHAIAELIETAGRDRGSLKAMGAEAYRHLKQTSTVDRTVDALVSAARMALR